ncbi:hypothetical protein Mal4_12060 [Maioricimonas rarisocia]|uniref:Glycine zipper domain-containing protein n=1 Tax=Maioricimonas rarisocia TaxID=2528026 RepID=A0A517Z355_9PLAN|nr:glycine zipper domain-containing protein [Maioricimonas rarisocia]QDU36905.1 hypothetical protein Mal4_12060 [Maioricimonas rarisocia]
MNASAHLPALLCLLIPVAAGCHGMNHTQAGAAFGSGVGALTGAVIGSQSGHAAGGAVIGAATGAMAGGLIGNAEDAREERDAAIAQAQFAQYQAQNPPLTNADLIFMAQSGLGEQVIVNSIQTRGGQFDLSPQGLVQLKNSGVSDGVIVAIQQSAASGSAPAAAAPVPAIARTEVVVVEPRPSFGVIVAPRPRPIVVGPPRHFHGPRRRGHLHVHF